MGVVILSQLGESSAVYVMVIRSEREGLVPWLIGHKYGREERWLDTLQFCRCST